MAHFSTTVVDSLSCRGGLPGWLSCYVVTWPRLVWRLPLALRSMSPTTFYPCGFRPPSPNALCVFRRLLEGPEETTPPIRRQSAGPEISGSPPPAPIPRVTLYRQSVYPALSTAPAGNTPVSRKRQSAMSNLRATATIPIRLKRLPPLPKRSRNQQLKALSG